MSRVYRKPKEVEQFLIWEFVCEALHYATSRCEWCESPDSVLTLRKGAYTRRVAIEHTGYFNDTVAGKCSPLTPISDFWKSVQTSLGRRFSQRKDLAELAGRVRLHTRRLSRRLDPATRETLARQFAGELADFLRTNPVTTPARFPRYSASAPGTEFYDFPRLKELVDNMRVRRSPGLALLPRCSWLCGNITTGSIGLNLDYVKSSVKRKNKKAAKYDWRSADEKWLLIVAGGSNLSEQAGIVEDTEWNDSELRALCHASPFDRIYFWERIRCWYKSLKPRCRIVCTRRTGS